MIWGQGLWFCRFVWACYLIDGGGGGGGGNGDGLVEVDERGMVVSVDLWEFAGDERESWAWMIAVAGGW